MSKRTWTGSRLTTNGKYRLAIAFHAVAVVLVVNHTVDGKIRAANIVRDNHP
jgi:hypothetical protein